MKHFKTLGFVAGLLLMTGCSSSVESQFKKSCRDGGGNSSFCSCLYEQVTGYYGKDKFESMVKGQSQPPNDYNDKVMQAAYAVIVVGYWFYLIWALGVTSAGKAYLFGRAIMWPFILLGKLF